ncbi:MAG: hypothetical protein AAB352_03025 [Patescibacteria group bacterium]
MKEAQQKPVNRCFDGAHCPKDSKQQKEEKIKEAFRVSVGKRKDANRALCLFAERLHCGLPGLLSAIEQQVRGGRLSLYVFEVLIERVEGQRERNGLSYQQIADLENAKIALKQFKESV